METKKQKIHKEKELCYVGKHLSFWGLTDYLNHVTKCSTCQQALSPT